MAKIEEVVTVRVRVKDNQFGFDDLCSFQTNSFIGEWNGFKSAYVIYGKSSSTYAGDMVSMIYANSLEELICKVKEELDEDIIEVYNHYITTLTFNIPK